MNQQTLTDIYREVDRKCASFYYMLTSKKEFEPKWFVPTKENLDTAWETYKELKSEITSLESPDPVYTLLKHHFFDFMVMDSLPLPYTWVRLILFGKVAVWSVSIFSPSFKSFVDTSVIWRCEIPTNTVSCK